MTAVKARTHIPIFEFSSAGEGEVLLVLPQFHDMWIDNERLQLDHTDVASELLLQHHLDVLPHGVDPLAVDSLLTHQLRVLLTILPASTPQTITSTPQ